MSKGKNSYITRLRNCLCIPTSVSVVLLMAGSMLSMYYVANGWVEGIVERGKARSERQLCTVSSLVTSTISNKYQNMVNSLLIIQNLTDSVRNSPAENTNSHFPIYNSILVTTNLTVPAGWDESRFPPSSPLGIGWWVD